MKRATLLIAIATALGGCGDDSRRERAWATCGVELREALLSVGGTSDRDVWAVGADKGEGPLVVHYDGQTWSELETGERAHLWWVHAFPGGPVIMAGSRSTILRYEDGELTRQETPGLSRHTVFGVWGRNPDELYAVGTFGPVNGFVWRYDGSRWVDVALPADIPADALGNTPGLFKVWGDTRGNVWAVGGGGLVLHKPPAGEFEVVPTDTTATLFTVSGNDDLLVIVGGGGVVLEGDPEHETLRSSVLPLPIAQGVFVSPEGQAVITGSDGVVLERGSGTWRVVQTGIPATVESLHAAWIDPTGGIWTVGGNVLGTTLDNGWLLHAGAVGAEVARYEQPAPPPPPSTDCPADAVDPTPEGSIARRWDEQLLNAIRRDIPRPPVHARNLFHVSAAMWDAWAAYDPVADGFFSDEKHAAADVAAARAEAISYAAFRVLSARYHEPIAVGAAVSQNCFRDFMAHLGYDPDFTSLEGDSPAALGNRVAQAILDHGAHDGANEENNYADTTNWTPRNEALVVDAGGNDLVEPSVWQQLNIAEAETQNGIPLGAGVQGYIGAHWREVTPFAMVRPSPGAPYQDAGPFPVFDAQLRTWVVDIITRGAKLDATLPETIDISPGAYGNNSLGANDGVGHPINPATGAPYDPNVVRLGDFARVLAEFWADGPRSETPPGHWHTIANAVAEHPGFERRVFGVGDVVDPLEWDVKMYLALSGATHDAAIAAWELKRDSLGGRPISWARYMATLGQSSDPSLPSYDPMGLPIIPGVIEMITAESSAPGERHAHLARYQGQLAVFSWRGEPGNRATEVSGAGWIRAAEWMPYQRRTFVTPAFPGFVSGHSTFSRAAAEVLAGLTGSAYFPGGLGEFVAPQGVYLVFERGPSAEVRLQWATYFDAADQAGQSRLWGGIHITPDDLGGRTIGSAIGVGALGLASRYFDGTARP